MNKKGITRGLIFLILAIVVSLSSCATIDKTDTSPFVKTMIRFDQAFIPALSMTNKGDPEGSVKAITILKSEWVVLMPEMIAFYPDDKKVTDYLEDVNSIIMDASEKLAAKDKLIEVHVTLESVKKPFKDIRALKKINYYPDLLDAYHTTMEEILSITTNKSASDISKEDMSLIERLAKKGLYQWTVIQTSPFDNKLFGFSESKNERLKKSIEDGKNESIHFVETVVSGDKEAMLKEAAGLKPYYTKVYLQFGNFVRLQK